MFDDVREELEEILDGFEAGQDPSGARLVALPCGAELKVLLPEDSPDLYAEAAVMSLEADACDSARCRDLATLNFFWRDLQGFTVALRGGTLMVQSREDLARMADEDVFEDWLRRADRAVRTVRAVAVAPRTAEGVDEASESAGAAETEVSLWP